MSGFLNYGYVFLWLVLAVMALIVGRKEGLTAWVMAAFFIFMTVWYGLRAFAGIAMFEGTLGIVFKVIAAAFVIALVLVWYLKRRKQ